MRLWELGSNQTVAGLKRLYLFGNYNNGLCSNQTVAGLKRYIIIHNFTICRKFKSDRCGIETLNFEHIGVHLLCSNQTVAGLKLRCITIKSSWRGRSNQTVAGLKLTNTPGIDTRWWAFKSDRCGIETYTLTFSSAHSDFGSNQTVAGLKRA